MSSLLELIARRRRASASRRLGPPPSAVNGAGGRRKGETAAPDPSNGNGHALPELVLPVLAWPAGLLVHDEEQLTMEIERVELEPERVELEPERVELEPERVELEPEPEDVEPEPEDVEPEDVEPEPEPLRKPPRYESWLPPSELISLPARPPLTVEQETAGELIPPPGPAETEPARTPGTELVPARPGFVSRGRMRRRARYLRRLREIQLRDIGGFALELYRLGRSRPELVRDKIETALRTDSELRALERALTGGIALRELREPGVGGACSACGAVHGSADRYCAACGRPLQESEGA